MKCANMLHGTIPACMVVGSAHHVYLLKQPFQLRLQCLLLLLQLLRRRPLGHRLLLLPHEWLPCGKLPHL